MPGSRQLSELKRLKGARQVRRVGAVELGPPAIGRVGEAQRRGVQPLPGQAQPLGEDRVGAVEQVPRAGMAQGRHVHPDLVRPPRFQLDLDQAGGPERFDRVVVGHAGAAAVDHREPPVPGGVPADRRIHGAAQRVGMTLDQGVVALVHRALAERTLQRGVGGLALGHHHQPGGAGVQPVHDPLALGGPGTGDGVPAGPQARQHGGPGPARRRVRRDPGGLVHHDDVLVLGDDGQAGNRLLAANGAAEAGGGGRVTSSHSPAGTRCDFAAGRPSTRTFPLVTRSAAVARDRPNMRASAASSRSPSSPSGTVTRRGPPAVTSGCPPAGPLRRIRGRRPHRRRPGRPCYRPARCPGRPAPRRGTRRRRCTSRPR